MIIELPNSTMLEIVDERLSVIEVSVAEERISVVEIDVGFQSLGTGSSEVSFSSRTVIEDFDVDLHDFEVIIDATNGPITGSLPANPRLRRLFHFKRIDTTENIVKIVAFEGDNIDGSSFIVLTGQYSDALLFAADFGYWDNFGSSGEDLGEEGPTVEVPTGAVDGSNIIFTTTQVFSFIAVYLNGLRLQNEFDYIITNDDEITMNEAPLPGDSILVEYRI